MATLRKTKKRLTDAIDAAKIRILKGEDAKVMIDLDGDGKADAVLIDTNDSGTPDLLAFDLTGDNKFNLYLDDTDNTEYPDTIYVDEKGDGNIHLLSMGDTIKNKSHQKLIKIYATLVDDESSIDDTYDALRSLAKVVKELKRRANK